MLAPSSPAKYDYIIIIVVGLLRLFVNRLGYILRIHAIPHIYRHIGRYTVHIHTHTHTHTYIQVHTYIDPLHTTTSFLFSIGRAQSSFSRSFLFFPSLQLSNLPSTSSFVVFYIFKPSSSSSSFCSLSFYSLVFFSWELLFFTVFASLAHPYYL